MYQRLAALLALQQSPLYAILDGARDRTIAGRIGTSGLHYKSLYEGEPGEHLAPFGPFLISIPADPDFINSWLTENWGRSQGVYLTCSQSFASLRRHLRRFLTVQLEDGRKVYFRFYDPRVLRMFLPNCTYEEWIDFFGPIETYLTESIDGKSLLRFWREADAPEPDRIELVA